MEESGVLLHFVLSKALLFPAKSLSISGCDHRMGLGPKSLQSHTPLFVLSPSESTAAGAGRRLAEDVPRDGVCALTLETGFSAMSEHKHGRHCLVPRRGRARRVGTAFRVTHQDHSAASPGQRPCTHSWHAEQHRPLGLADT